MTQQTAPFLEGKYGWSLGESNWNLGMDENLLKFSFMFDRNIEGIVSSLPAVVNGTAYFLTTDNRLYFGASDTWYSTPVPKWSEFQIRATGEVYQFDGTDITLIPSNLALESEIQTKEPAIPVGANSQFWRGDKTFQVPSKADVGLAAVDNTSDAGKPVSTAQQTALDQKANLVSPTFTGTVGGITKSMVGLGSVDNTADSAKPVSTAQQTALNLKVSTSSTRAVSSEIVPPITNDDGYNWGYNSTGTSVNGNGNAFNYYQLNIANDAAVQQVGLNGATGSKVSGLNILHNFGGATSRGGRHAVQGKLLQGFGGSGATDAGNQDRFYVGIQGQVLSDTGDGGTGVGDLRGAYFGSSSYAGVYGGASYVANLTGAEFNTDIQIGSGATAGVRVSFHTGVQVASLIGERGFNLDSCYSGSCLGGSTRGWKYGLSYHGLNGGPAFEADSTVLKVFPSASASAAIDTVIDVTGVTTAALIRSTGCTLTETGVNFNKANAFMAMGNTTASVLTQSFKTSGTASTYDSRWSYSGGSATIGQGVVQLEANGLITPLVRPFADNTQSLGLSSFRWSVVYAGTGTINTSDATEKTEVSPFTQAETNAAKTLAKEIGTFKWLASVQAKGEDARTHIGLTVQRAIEIMEANNLEPMTYGFICYDEWEATEAVVREDEDGKIEILQPATEAGSRYGFRMDQLNLFIAAGFEARLSALENL